MIPEREYRVLVSPGSSLLNVKSHNLSGMGGAGFEPAKAMPPDLQSGPFSHLGIHPALNKPVAWTLEVKSHSSSKGQVVLNSRTELAVRVELTTVGLQNRCSAN